MGSFATSDHRLAGHIVGRAVAPLMGVATFSFAMASAIHFGLTFPLGTMTVRDPFPGAAVPEAIVAVALGVGVGGVVAGLTVRWPLALSTSLFAALLTVYGLTVTMRSSRTGDIAYHLAVLVVLGVTLCLLLAPTARRSMNA